MVKYCQFTIFLFLFLTSSVFAAPVRWEQLGGVVGYTLSGLPQAAERGMLARVTDQNDKLVIFNGTTWVDIVGLSDLGSVLSASTVAALPTTGPTGKLMRLSNGAASGAVVIFDGADWRCLEEKTERHFTVTCPPYNALADDTGNDAVAIQAAVNATPTKGGTVIIPSGTYRVTSPIILPNDGRQVTLRGTGRSATLIHVPTTFAGGPGIIQLRDGGEIKPTVERIGIFFDQPDSSSIAAMTQYPPAIYAQGGGRFTIRDMQITRAWDGLDLRGPNGGMIVQNLEMSSFNKGIQIDGAQDTNEFSDIHQWVFGMSGNQMLAAAGNGVSLTAARVDGLLVTNYFVLGQTGFHFTTSASGSPSCAQLTNISTDSGGGAGVLVEGGCVTITGFTGATYAPVLGGDHLLKVTGGIVTVDTGIFGVGATPHPLTAMILIEGGAVSLRGIFFGTSGVDCKHIEVTSGNVTMTGMQFQRLSNVPYTEDSLKIGAGGRVSAVGNFWFDLANTAATAISVAADNWHTFTGNIILGSWVNSLPAAPDMMQSFGNIGLVSRGQIGLQSVQIAGGTPISGALARAATLDFPPTLANACTDVSVPLVGVVDGWLGFVDPPAGSVGTAAQYQAFSAVDVVVVRLCCIGAACDPPTSDFLVGAFDFAF